MTVVVQRSFIIERGSFGEFERLSREAIWPYMEARGCKILGFFTNLHGGPGPTRARRSGNKGFALPPRLAGP